MSNFKSNKPPTSQHHQDEIRLFVTNLPVNSDPISVRDYFKAKFVKLLGHNYRSKTHLGVGQLHYEQSNKSITDSLITNCENYFYGTTVYAYQDINAARAHSQNASVLIKLDEMQNQEYRFRRYKQNSGQYYQRYGQQYYDAKQLQSHDYKDRYYSYGNYRDEHHGNYRDDQYNMKDSYSKLSTHNSNDHSMSGLNLSEHNHIHSQKDGRQIDIDNSKENIKSDEHADSEKLIISPLKTEHYNVELTNNNLQCENVQLNTNQEHLECLRFDDNKIENIETNSNDINTKTQPDETQFQTNSRHQVDSANQYSKPSHTVDNNTNTTHYAHQSNTTHKDTTNQIPPEHYNKSASQYYNKSRVQLDYNRYRQYHNSIGDEYNSHNNTNNSHNHSHHNYRNYNNYNQYDYDHYDESEHQYANEHKIVHKSLTNKYKFDNNNNRNVSIISSETSTNRELFSQSNTPVQITHSNQYNHNHNHQTLNSDTKLYKESHLFTTINLHNSSSIQHTLHILNPNDGVQGESQSNPAIIKYDIGVKTSRDKICFEFDMNKYRNRRYPFIKSYNQFQAYKLIKQQQQQESYQKNKINLLINSLYELDFKWLARMQLIQIVCMNKKSPESHHKSTIIKSILCKCENTPYITKLFSVENAIRTWLESNIEKSILNEYKSWQNQNAKLSCVLQDENVQSLTQSEYNLFSVEFAQLHSNQINNPEQYSNNELLGRHCEYFRAFIEINFISLAKNTHCYESISMILRRCDLKLFMGLCHKILQQDVNHNYTLHPLQDVMTNPNGQQVLLELLRRIRFLLNHDDIAYIVAKIYHRLKFYYNSHDKNNKFTNVFYRWFIFNSAFKEVLMTNDPQFVLMVAKEHKNELQTHAIY